MLLNQLSQPRLDRGSTSLTEVLKTLFPRTQLRITNQNGSKFQLAKLS